MQLYELIKKVSDILTPETDVFYNYVLHTSDDNGGFLRTRYCWWDRCVKDRSLDDEYKKVLVTSVRPIDADTLAELVRNKKSHLRLQFQYWCADPTVDDADVDVELGYCYVYIFDLEQGNFTMEHRKIPY